MVELEKCNNKLQFFNVNLVEPLQIRTLQMRLHVVLCLKPSKLLKSFMRIIWGAEANFYCFFQLT